MTPLALARYVIAAQAAILKNVEFDLSGGCWLWSGPISNTGEGRVSIMGQRHLAHRAAWSAFVGDLPPHPLGVGRKCRVAACVNPDHLYAASISDSAARKRASGGVAGEIDRLLRRVYVGGADECWPWRFTVNNYRFPYGSYRFSGQTQKAHRVSWQLHYGPIPNGMSVCHKCDNPPCINPAHLFLGTHAENMADMASKGRAGAPRGEASKCAKLTADQVLSAKRDLATDTVSEVARRFGVAHSTMRRIKTGEGWKCLLA